MQQLSGLPQTFPFLPPAATAAGSDKATSEPSDAVDDGIELQRRCLTFSCHSRAKPLTSRGEMSMSAKPLSHRSVILTCCHCFLPAVICGIVAMTSEAAKAVADQSTPVAGIKNEAARDAEVIHVRYPNGRVKIERHVAINAVGRYVNHGDWRKWDATGSLVAAGQYDSGLRVGPWTQWFQRNDAPVLRTAPFDQFESPFVSRANFLNDEMDGEWIISDVRGRKCSRITFKDGKRNGPATLWLHDGRVFRNGCFLHGLPVGEFWELGSDAALTKTASYVAGAQIVNKVTHFPDGQHRHIEATCLVSTVREVAPDDFSGLRFAKYAAQEEDVLHGSWKSWYSNGQVQCEGNYDRGREAGMFVWWHANGTQAVHGHFVNGQPDGFWTWWHPNGEKAAQTRFAGGEVMNCVPLPTSSVLQKAGSQGRKSL
jgi:antitoxin component YwqK of YwqJK toxin-antitoxin module